MVVAGAASELACGALIVNPHEREGTAAALKRALEMPLAERQWRYQRMMAVLKAHDIDHWAQGFLDELSPSQRSGAQGAQVSWSEVAANLVKRNRLQGSFEMVLNP